MTASTLCTSITDADVLAASWDSRRTRNSRRHWRRSCHQTRACVYWFLSPETRSRCLSISLWWCRYFTSSRLWDRMRIQRHDVWSSRSKSERSLQLLRSQVLSQNSVDARRSAHLSSWLYSFQRSHSSRHQVRELFDECEEAWESGLCDRLESRHEASCSPGEGKHRSCSEFKVGEHDTFCQRQRSFECEWVQRPWLLLLKD